MKILCHQTEMSPNTDVLLSETSFVAFPDLSEKRFIAQGPTEGREQQGEGEREREVSSAFLSHHLLFSLLSFHRITMTKSHQSGVLEIPLKVFSLMVTPGKARHLPN